MVPEELKGLIALIPQTGTKGERERHIQNVVDELHNVLLRDAKWDNKALEGIENQENLYIPKETVVRNYRKEVFKGDPQKLEYAKLFGPLRKSFTRKLLHDKTSFNDFSLDFMRFLLYKYFSEQSKDFLFDHLFISPHKKELKDSPDSKTTGESIKKYLRENIEDLSFIHCLQLYVPGNKTRREVEDEGEKIMMEAFFSKPRKSSSESSGDGGKGGRGGVPDGSGNLLPIILSVVAIALVAVIVVFFLLRKRSKNTGESPLS